SRRSTWRSRSSRNSKVAGCHVHNHVRITARQLIDDRRRYERVRLRTSDPYFSHQRVCKKFDVPHALLQFIKYREATLEQRTAIDRWLDAHWASVEQP